jgi:predicted GH43/DUF377 family glycosyl hydrolase
MELVTKHGVILKKTNYSFENLGVFNPAAIQDGQIVHLFYRAVKEGNFSTIGYCKLDGPLTVIERHTEPIFIPRNPQEIQGIEDPRIAKIEDSYYMSYSAYDGFNVFGAYATSKDLKTFKRMGFITPKFTFEEYSKLIMKNFNKINSKHFDFYRMLSRYNLPKVIKEKVYVWDKNVVFFPKKIKGKYAVLHRLYPSIQIFYFDDPAELTQQFWEDYISNLQKHIVLTPKCKHESSHIGAGCPPIETKAGWLLIYHSAQSTPSGYIYHAAAALLDLENPKKLIAKLKYPLFSPQEDYETKGYVHNVVFPTGTARFGDELYIYYGAADSSVAVASLNINSLIDKLITP